MRRWYQDLVHGDLKQLAEGIEIIHAGQALSSLPFVDCLRLFESKKPLHIPDGKTPLLAQPKNVCSGRRRINDRKRNDRHKTASILAGQVYCVDHNYNGFAVKVQGIKENVRKLL